MSVVSEGDLVRSETDVVLDHALRSEENLLVAAMIGAAFEQLCGRVIAGVLETAAAELGTLLGPAWQVTACDAERLAARNTEYLVARRPNVPAGPRVLLSADEAGYPKSPYIAVRFDGLGAAAGGVAERLKKVIDEEYRKGASSSYSAWYRYFDKPNSEWGTPDGLVRLYRKTDAAAFLVSNLEQVARAIEKAD